MKYRNAIAAALAVAALAGCRNNVYVVVPTQDGKAEPAVVPSEQDKQSVKPTPKPPAPDNVNPAPKPPVPDNVNPAPKPPAPDNANPAPEPPAPKPPAPVVQDRRPREPVVPVPRAVYAVAVSPEGEGAKKLAEAIGFDVRAGLTGNGRAVAAAGAKPGKGEKPVTIDISVSRRDVSRLGDFRLCEGVAKVCVIDGGKEIASKKFIAEGKRADNKIDAERGVCDELAKQIVKWVGGLTVPKTK